MTEQEWIKIGLEIEEPLKKIRSIARKNGLDCISMAVFSNGCSWATYIDDSTDEQFEARINRDDTTSLLYNQSAYYTKS